MCPLPEAAPTASPTYNPVLKMDPGFVLIRYSKTWHGRDCHKGRICIHRCLEIGSIQCDTTWDLGSTPVGQEAQSGEGRARLRAFRDSFRKEWARQDRCTRFRLDSLNNLGGSGLATQAVSSCLVPVLGWFRAGGTLSWHVSLIKEIFECGHWIYIKGTLAEASGGHLLSLGICSGSSSLSRIKAPTTRALRIQKIRKYNQYIPLLLQREPLPWLQTPWVSSACFWTFYTQNHAVLLSALSIHSIVMRFSCVASISVVCSLSLLYIIMLYLFIWSADGRLCGFQRGSNTNPVAVNILVHVSRCTCSHTFHPGGMRERQPLCPTAVPPRVCKHLSPLIVPIYILKPQ